MILSEEQNRHCNNKKYKKDLAVHFAKSQTVDKVPVFAGTFTMSTVFLV